MSDGIEREMGAMNATQAHILKEVERIHESVQGIDERLRSVETKGALNGAVTGGAIALVIAFVKDKFTI